MRRIGRFVIAGLVGCLTFGLTWGTAEGAFHLDRSSALTLAGFLSGLFAVGFGFWAAKDTNSPFPVPAIDVSRGLERLRSTVSSQTAEQVATLTGPSAISVPWATFDYGVGRTGDRRVVPLAEDRLASFIESGGQLIILGGSQSGKTTLATRLVQLMSGHSERQPVLFPLSRWNPGQIGLRPWMLDVLRTTYGLANPDDVVACELALDNGTIVPVFDGFDEIDASFRDAVADSIRILVTRHPAILTSIPPDDGMVSPSVALPDADTIVLLPISAAEVSGYLCDGDTRDIGPTQWGPIISEMATHPMSPIGIALSSPLIVWLAKTVYTGRRAIVPSQQRADASELLKRTRFPSARAIEDYLLARLVTAVFAIRNAVPRTNSPARNFRPADAERWLRFLASHASLRTIAFWELRKYAPLLRLSLVIAVLIGALIDSASVIDLSFPELSFLTLIAGCVFGFGFSRGYASGRSIGPEDPTRIGFGYTGKKDGDLGLHVSRLLNALTFVVCAYAAAVISNLAVRGQFDWLFGLTAHQSLVGLVFVSVLCFGVAGISGRTGARLLRSSETLDARMGAKAADPLDAITFDRRSGVFISLYSFAFLAAGFSTYSLVFLPRITLWGLLACPSGAAITTFMWNEWACFKAAHVWLALRDRLPWRFASFLRVCADGGILRRNGNHFEFRHRRLQRSLIAHHSHGTAVTEGATQHAV